MTYPEIAKLLAILKVTYPNAQSADPTAQVRAWAMALSDIPYALAEAAIQRHVKRSKWHPTPSEIRELIADAHGVLPDEATAWQMVRQYIRDNGYINPAPWSGPSIVLEAVRAIGGFRQLRMSESPDRDRDAFGRAYRTYRERALGEIDLGLAVEELAAGNLPVAAIGG